MAGRHSTPVLESVKRLFSAGTMTGAGERQLLDRFIADGDEDAFEAIVRRHGPMVLGVCRRILSDPNDVEDAFQATFLILVKRAGSIRDRSVLGTWLHGVARRVAVRARVNARRLRAREQVGVEMATWHDRRPGNEGRAELRSVIDQEVGRLPERYRSPLVLCDLEGRTQEQAAAALGCPVGTVKSRLSRARDRLRSGLTRRGFAPSAGALASLLAPDSTPAMTAELLAATIGAAARLAAGRTLAAGAVPAAVAALVEQTSRSMSMNALKLAVVLAAAGFVVTGTGTFAYQAGGSKAPQPGPPVVPAEADFGKASPRPLDFTKVTSKPSGTDPRPAEAAPGDANVNPDSAGGQTIASLAQSRYERAVKNLEFHRAGHKANPDPMTRQALHSWALRVLEAQRDLGGQKANQVAALENYLNVWKEVEKEVKPEDKDERAVVEYFRLEAELWLAQAKAGAKPAIAGPGVDGPPRPGTGIRPGTDPRSLALLARLEEPIAMNFPSPTPLEDVLKYIQQATAGPDSVGIQIYIDPVNPAGVDEEQAANDVKLMKTPISMNLEGVPLRRVLKLLAEQIGMGYGIKDGMVTMRPPNMRDRNWQELLVMEESFPDSSPLAQEVERARRGELTAAELSELDERLKAIDEVTKRYRSVRMLGVGMGGMMMGRMPGAAPGGMTPGPARAPGGSPP